MTKIQMPEPVAYLYKSPAGHAVNIRKYEGGDLAPGVIRYDLIPTDQAEAYAAAKVREALECVSREVHNVLHPTNPREDWTQYAYIREESAHDAESAIRALIPQHDNE